MVGPGPHVFMIKAAFTEQAVVHALQRWRPVDQQICNIARANIPALQHEAPIVHTVIIVQVGEQRVGNGGSLEPSLDEPLMGAGAVVQHDRLAADLDEIPRTLPLGGGRRSAVPNSVNLIARLCREPATCKH